DRRARHRVVDAIERVAGRRVAAAEVRPEAVVDDVEAAARRVEIHPGERAESVGDRRRAAVRQADEALATGPERALADEDGVPAAHDATLHQIRRGDSAYDVARRGHDGGGR